MGQKPRYLRQPLDPKDQEVSRPRVQSTFLSTLEWLAEWNYPKEPLTPGNYLEHKGCCSLRSISSRWGALDAVAPDDSWWLHLFTSFWWLHLFPSSWWICLFSISSSWWLHLFTSSHSSFSSLIYTQSSINAFYTLALPSIWSGSLTTPRLRFRF